MKGCGKSVGALLILVFLCVTGALTVSNVGGVFDDPMSLLILNTVLVFGVSLFVCWVSARSYLKSGLPVLLFGGSGVLMWGFSGLLRGLLNIAYNYNAAGTAHNLVVFFSSGLHLIGAASFASTRRVFARSLRRPSLVITYLCVAVAAFLAAVAAIHGSLPLFWGTTGPTLIREVVLGTAITLFFVSFLIYMTSYLASRSDFHYWYSLALGLIGVSLLDAFLVSGSGTSLRWLGRTGQWLGTLYFVMAVLSARRLAFSKGASLTDTLASLFTERKKLLAEIESLARFPTENPHPVMRLNRDKILFANAPSESFLRNLGVELNGSPPKILQDLYFEVMNSKSSKTIEHTLGDRVYSLLIVPITESGYVNMYGLDITEHKKADEELRESMRRLRRTEEIAHLGSWELDLATNRLTWSDEVYRIFDLKPQEFDATYEAFLKHVHPEDRAAVDAAYFGSLREGKEGYEIEHRILRRSTGEIRVVHEKCEHIRDESGRVVRSLGIVQDITERKRLEGLRDQFISAVTHELRTPLVAIKGYTDYLLTGNLGELPPKVESSLKVVKESSDRLLGITDELLDYRRLVSGKFQPTLKPIDLKDTIDTCVKEIQPALEKKNQKLEVKIPKESLPVQGDHARLVQVVMNLLHNASKFTPEKGTIRIRVEKEASSLEVSVSDTGLGIRLEDLIRVFEPFAAIEKPTYIKGTGLGLSVSRALVEAHGGLIWAESDGIGKGATFTFTIPART